MFVSLVLVLILTATNFFPAHAIPTGSWKKTKFSAPPVDKVQYMCLPDGILIVGGRNPGQSAVSGTYLLNITTATWSTYPQSGSFTPVYAAYHTSVGKDLYIFGGNIDQFDLTADMVTFSYERTAFKVLASSDSRPTSRTRGAAVNIPGTKNILFAFGYTNSEIMNEMNIYDTVQRTWITIPPDPSFPNPRFEPCCKPTETEWYCFGGYGTESALNDVWALNFTTFKWRKIVTVNTQYAPTPRRASQCVIGTFQNRNIFVITGGFGEVTNFVHSLDLTTLSWVRVQQQMVHVRGGGAMCSFDSLGFAVMAAGTIEEGNINTVKIPYNTLLGEELIPAITALDRRSFASGALVGTTIYMFFGIDYKTIYGDGWRFNTSSHNWTQVFQNAAGVQPRYGAAAVTYGRIILILGGFKNVESFSSEFTEVVQFNSVSKVCDMLKTTNEIPGRAYHAAGAHGKIVVVFGGTVGAQSQSNDMKVFNYADLTWYDVVVSKTLPPRLSSHMLLEPQREESLYLIGGIELGDRWELKISKIGQVDQTKYFANAVQFPSEIPSNDPDYLRGEAAVAGDRTWVLLCGGSRTTLFPVSDEDNCIIWNAATGSNTRTDPMPTMTYGSYAVYFGRTVFVVGGSIAAGGLKRPQFTLSEVQMYTFDTLCESLTNVSGAARKDCVYCSSGTTYDAKSGDCVPAPPGTYAVNSILNHCPPGTFSGLTGASSLSMCVQCPPGTYAPASGSRQCLTCPVGKECKFGASEPADPSGKKPTKVEILSPDDSGSVPYSVWVTLAIWTGVGLLTAASLPLIKVSHDSKMLSHYRTKEAEDTLNAVFEDFTTSMGMNEIGFLNAMHDPRMKCSPLTSEQALRVFRNHDTDGNAYVDREEFAIAVIALIDLGFIQPFPGSGRALTGERISYWFIKMLTRIDAYVTDHKIGSQGDPVRLQMTLFGGYVSVIKYVGVVVIIVALTCIFVYDNTVENLSTLPLGTDNDVTFSGDTTVVVTLTGPQSMSYCEVSKVLWNMTAIHSSSVAIKTLVIGQSCRITWFCEECILSMAQESVLMIELLDDVVFAESATFQFIFASGNAVRTSQLSSHRTMRYMSDSTSLPLPAEGEVYKGSPASVIQVAVTPVKLKTFKSAFDLSDLIITGYQGRVIGDVKSGNMVNNIRFSHVANVPFKIIFQPAEVMMFVNQQPRQSIIDLLTSILAALSGLSAGLLVVLNLVESRMQGSRHIDLEGMHDDKYNPSESSSRNAAYHDIKMLHGLLRENVPAGAAIETLELIREVSRQCVSDELLYAGGIHKHSEDLCTLIQTDSIPVDS